jgi:hypothetical protein
MQNPTNIAKEPVEVWVDASMAELNCAEGESDVGQGSGESNVGKKSDVTVAVTEHNVSATRFTLHDYITYNGRQK